VLLAAATVPRRASAHDSLAHLREEFQQEHDPVKRARRFPRLGSALIAEMRRLEDARQFDAVPPLYREYHDDATAAFDGLMAGARDAERHPKGFRELEIHFRDSLRSLNDLLYGVPLDDRESLRKAQHDIEIMDDRLVQALFPRVPDKPRTPPSGPAEHPLS